MKRIFIPAAFAAVSLLIANCAAKKTATVAKPVSNSTTLLETAKGIDPNATQAMLDMGKQILTTNCARCHGAKDPLKFSAEEWNKDMERMIVKAKMTEDQASPLRLYTKAVLKQAGK